MDDAPETPAHDTGGTGGMADSPRHVSEHADLGRIHRGMVAARDTAQVEIEAMEFEPFHELAERLGLEGG